MPASVTQSSAHSRRSLALRALLTLALIAPGELAAQQDAVPSLPPVAPPASAGGFATGPAVGQASAPAGVPQLTGNCDLLSSDTVRAVFHEITSNDNRDYIARFEVVELLAHQNGASAQPQPLQAGDTVDILLRRDIPGQPAGILEDLVAMKQGQLALMRLDRLFMLEPQDYGERLVCARFRPLTDSSNVPAGGESAAPTTPPQAGDSAATGSLSQPRGKVTTKIEVGNDGSIRERIFVNGEEILPPEVQTLEPEEASPRSSSGGDVVPSNVIPEEEGDTRPGSALLQPSRYPASYRGGSVSISGSSRI